MLFLRYAGFVMCVGWLMCLLYSFRVYWHDAMQSYTAARTLLGSDVCMQPAVRVLLHEFDQCAQAELQVAIAPLQRALFRVGQDVHLCGNGRCEILYMDITARIVPFLVLATILALCLLCKCARDARYKDHVREGEYWKLPRVKAD
jgi:hypothetical protein